MVLRTEPALRNGFLHVFGLLLNSSYRLAHLRIVQLRKLEVALPLLRSLNLGWKSASGNGTITIDGINAYHFDSGGVEFGKGCG